MNWLGNSLVSPENSSGPFFQLEFDPTVWQLLTETRSFLVHRSLADCQIQTTKVGEVGIGDPDFRIEHSNITLGNIQYEKNAIFYKGAVSFFTYFTDAGKSDFYAGFLITAPEHCLKEAEEVLKTLKTVADPTNLATPAP